jgi:hypothetical protein
MSKDLSNLLREWPYEAGQINVRLVEGDDGRPLVQLRLDLGLLQMEMSGRPDGQSIDGFESALEMQEESLGDSSGDELEPVVLSEDQCRQLRDEAVQYYHRYIALLILGEYDGVLRDTSRNLRVLDLCREHAEGEDDQQVLEQFRPYLLMMRARALASHMVSADEPKGALLALDWGLDEIRAVLEEAGQAEAMESLNEVQLLRGMRSELMKKLPASQKSELRQRLEEAIRAENYELAAILRDELNNLKDHA